MPTDKPENEIVVCYRCGYHFKINEVHKLNIANSPSPTTLYACNPCLADPTDPLKAADLKLFI